jgi:integrase/recombinase XerD
MADRSHHPEALAKTFLDQYDGSTLAGYQGALREWLEWCDGQDLHPIRDVKRRHILEYANWAAQERGLSARTITVRLNVINGYYKHAVLEGALDANPSAYIKRPEVEFRSTTPTLSRDEIFLLLDAARDYSARDHALFCLLGLNGLRIGEALALDVSDVISEDGAPAVSVSRRYGLRQTLPLAERTADAIEEAIGERDSGPLFLSKRTPGKRMARGDAQNLVKWYAKRVGIEQPISPQSFRRAFHTLSREAGVPEENIAAAAGHVRLRSVRYFDEAPSESTRVRDATHSLANYVERTPKRKGRGGK